MERSAVTPPDYAAADQLATDAFVLAASKVRDEELPLLVSDFQEQRMKPLMPEPLDWKKTSFKKVRLYTPYPHGS